MKKLIVINCFLILLSACVPAARPAHSQATEQADPIYESGVKIIPRSDFTEEMLVARTKQYISSKIPSKIEWIVTSEKDYSCACADGTDMIYDGYVSERNMCLGSYDIARIVQIGPSASIQIRFKDGRKSETILGKSNPLQIEGADFRIAHLRLIEVNDFIKVHTSDQIFASVDIVPTHPGAMTDKTSWGSLYESLMERLGTYSIFIMARRDFLFGFQSLAIPFVYPFSDIEKTLSWAEYITRDVVVCDVKKSNLECTQSISGVTKELSIPIRFHKKK